MGGKFLTYKRPTMFPQFFSRKILASGESADDFREVTADERAKMEAERDAWVRPPQELIDRFNKLCRLSPTYGGVHGGYNMETGYFECNGITDISTAEAYMMVELAPRMRLGCTETRGHCYDGRVAGTTVRTLFPYHQDMFGGSSQSLDKFFENWQNIEVVVFAANNPQYLRWAFSNCKKLREVHGLVAGCSDNKDRAEGAFTGCTNLETVEIIDLGVNLSLADSPVLRPESLEFISDNRRNRQTAVTIELHASAFARCTPELLAKAAEKNITITTP